MVQPNLHEVIAEVIRSVGRSLKPTEIASIIRENSLWLRKKDNQPPGPSQISARVNNYQQLFQVEDRKIALRDDTQSVNRLFRLTWNTNGWQRPISHKWKKSNQGNRNIAFENQAGFGGEEWLFNARYHLDGYQYGFIRGVQDLPNTVSIIQTAHLFTINQQSREYFLVGKIQNLEIIQNNDLLLNKAKNLFNRYEDEVVKELNQVGADPGILSEMPLVPNVRFKISGQELFESMLPAPVLKGPNFRRFVPYKVDTELQVTIGSIVPSNGFSFVPGIASSSEKYERTHTGASIVIERKHSEITKALEDYLAPKFSKNKNNLSVEKTAFGNNIADVVLLHSNKRITIMEVKTSLFCRPNIRAAIGQLLDYACWYPNIKIEKLVIVAPTALPADENDYLTRIARSVNFPISYWQYISDASASQDAFIELI
ncbi:hypothetical protein [Pseudoflavitalea rhizosphaerae]|uniref:hypothetical protein n=1 Tax=Pseudoflavitalea rhizosphaerae TaxID=1884793 RepID=UPI000F8EF4FA|nr:hypothetical protein [Pseudoflavitalea rhizosphaerae]